MQQKIRDLNFIILLLAAIISIVLLIYVGKLWRGGFTLWWHLLSLYIWAIIPYAIMTWLNIKQTKNKKQAIVLLIFILAIAIFGVGGYIYAISLHHLPQLGLAFVVIPLYQFIACMIAIPVTLLFKS